MIHIIITSFFLGLGLAMDAAAVSMANGLEQKDMNISKVLIVSLLFGVFQGAMPLLGYFVGAAVLTKIEWIIPWVALILLLFIGGKMIYDGTRHDCGCNNEIKPLTITTILLQALATSIDALSVGFTISNYSILEAIVSAIMICIVTFIICIGATYIGKKFGCKLGKQAVIFGGTILILIGLEIFITGIFF